MTNADKQWIEKQKQGTNHIFTQDNMLIYLIPESLFDKLRRDAKDEQARIDVQEYQKHINDILNAHEQKLKESKKEKFDEIINLIKKDEKEYLEKHDIIIGFYCRGLVEELNSTIKKSIERGDKNGN